jgi:ATP-binding cassette subfamily A (ABC1) protein 5
MSSFPQVKGELRCLGSTQHLKNKYGGGYVLEIKRHASAAGFAWEALEAHIDAAFPDVDKAEAFADRRLYNIPQASVKSLADAFATLERCE